MKYRKKPIVIEAERFTWDKKRPVTNRDMFMEWPVQSDERGPHLLILTLEGNHRADPGDWIITGDKGEKYPCKPDIFAATYEPALP